LLVTTVLTPVVGRLADMWGRKRLYNSGFAIFVLGSLVAGLAQPQFHGADLILGRLIQGVGGALLVTNSTAIVTDAFRKGRVGLSMLAFPILSQSMTYALIVIGLISLILFGIIEPRIKDPMVQLRLFRERIFLMANLSGLLNGIARGAVLFLLIFFLQGPYGQDPLRAGLLLTPFGLAFMIVGPLSGLLSDRIGSRILTPIGLGISALGLLGLCTVTPSTPYWLLALYMVLMGGGSGFFVSPNTNAIMSSVEPHTRG